MTFILNRHPFTASEIFATELNPVFEKFFEAPAEPVAKETQKESETIEQIENDATEEINILTETKKPEENSDED